MLNLVPPASDTGTFTVTLSWDTPAAGEAARQVVAAALAAASAAGLPVMLEQLALSPTGDVAQSPPHEPGA